jgi:hypothetical protein
MSKPSQAALFRQLKQAADPAEQCDRALDLLAETRSREYVDATLRVLAQETVRERLGHDHRPILRAKALYYFEHDDRDRGGLIREQIIRLLTRIGHPGDADLYQQGLATYQRQPATDTAQNLRAAALIGLARADAELGCAYAVKLLGEPDTSELSGEPTLTAMAVLAQHGQLLPLYGFVLHRGRAFVERGMGEVVGKGLELLAGVLPQPLYAPLAESFAALDAPTISSSIADLYALLEGIITGTRHDDVHRYAVILLAASRAEPLVAMLYRLAKTCPSPRVMNVIEAVDLTPASTDRDALLRALERRL